MVTVISPYDGLNQQAAARPDRLFIAAPASAALPYAPDGLAISFAAAFVHIEALRRAYAAAGYGHGACVALLLENRPEFVFSDFDYVEMVAHVEPHPEAIRLGSDPYKVIRPEGRWHVPGILEESASRPATNPSVASKI